MDIEAKGSVTFPPKVRALDAGALRAARERWNAVAKPIAGLGELERMIEKIAGLTGSADVVIDKRAVLVLCADNGVTAQGVSQSGPEVTTAVARNIALGVSSVCMMARPCGADVFAVDMGMRQPPEEAGIIGRSVARGTADISLGPAMDRDQAIAAVRAGVELVADFKRRGYQIIASGEMGIGNTTTASAMTAAFLGCEPVGVTGRGAGLSDAGLARKLKAIERALAVNKPDVDDALGVLALLGGFDIAGLAGLFIGGAAHRVPIIVDGFVSSIAAYAASRICPGCECAMLPSHVSAEPAAHALLEALGLRAPIQADMRLGEGTGAVLLFPLLDAALQLYRGTTFEGTGIKAYEDYLR